MWANQVEEPDDELYGGYNDPAGRVVPLDTEAGVPPSRWGGGVPPQSRWGALPSTAAIGQPIAPRPMTSIRGAGYTSQPKPHSSAGAQQMFDPFNVGGRGPPPPLAQRADNSPEDKAKDMERKVSALVEEAAVLASKGNNEAALEKAKEAGKRERLLCKHRIQHGLQDFINIDLTYSVLFTLASMYHRSGMVEEALSTYSLIVKNKQYAQAGRLRVNMGNIYYEQRKYPNAIKMYRMALDQIPNTNRNVRFRIMRNIGNAFVRLGMFSDAISSYEAIMDGHPDYRTGFNLIICYFALGDAERMKRGFTQLLTIPQYYELEDGDGIEDDDEATAGRDQLRQDIMRRKKRAVEYISTAARLIAPAIDLDFEAGYDYLISLLRSSPFPEIALELENQKAVAYFKSRDFERATETLKAFVRTDGAMISRAATNLSFLYFLENDLKLAEKYAKMAVEAESYNAYALLNLGNVAFTKGEFERAAELYRDALGAEADCTEAIFNSGLAAKRTERYEEALRLFHKLRVIMPTSPEVIFHIADIHDRMGQPNEAIKWFNILQSRLSSDPGVLARLGMLYMQIGEPNQAFHHFSDSYNQLPTNVKVIEWLSGHYVTSDLFEKALPLLERAAQIEPNEPKWQLLACSCLKRMGLSRQALNRYEEILKRFPDNLDCVKLLVHLCTELGEGDKIVHYSKLQRRLEENMPVPAPEPPRRDSAASMPSVPTPPPQSVPQYQSMAPPPSPPENKRIIRAKHEDDVDEWGDGALGDELLPM